MKKSKAKIALSRMTLRSLSRTALGKAAGGSDRECFEDAPSIAYSNCEDCLSRVNEYCVGGSKDMCKTDTCRC